MQKENPIREKSFVFATEIVRFCIMVQKREKEYVVTKQLMKSGSSIGANVEEASQGQSRGDFIAKLSISLKEAYETHYWLRLIGKSGIADESETIQLLRDCEELMKILTAILKTSKAS